MADLDPVTVFSVIQKNIEYLGLQNFPCGTGSWRQKHDALNAVNKKQMKPKSHERNKNDGQHIAVTAGIEKTENLLELITSSFSPWRFQCNWSNEAKELREIAVKSPWLINPDFVYSYFKTLNIVDRAVTEVDSQLLKLKNLEELTLSANEITSVNSKFLPSSLKVLEMCANCIHDISDLCIMPPPLQHLGLGRNRISVVGDCISGVYWPNLVSLDLSHNDLCGLRDIVLTLCTLPRLRNLLLQGNPLSLTPGYRGYTIDCLPDLTVLDDKHISVDEKYDFKGLVKMAEYILDEAIVQIGVTSIRGLPCPAEVMYPDSQPEFPVILRSYFVQIIFPETQSLYNLAEMTGVDPEREMPDIALDKLPSSSKQYPGELKSSKFQQESQYRMQAESKTDDFKKVQTSDNKDGKGCETDMTQHTLTQLVPINTPLYKWEYELQLNWAVILVQSDLLFLRDFFKEGIEVHLVEQIVEAYPQDEFTSDKREDEKDKKRTKEQIKDKPKRKKFTEEELIKSPPTFTNIASFNFPLKSLLNGEFECQSTFRKIGDHTLIVDMIKSNEDISENVGLKDKKNISPKSPVDKKKEDSKRPSKETIGKKTNKGKQDEYTLPLELELTFQLHHWLKVSDAHKSMK